MVVLLHCPAHIPLQCWQENWLAKVPIQDGQPNVFEVVLDDKFEVTEAPGINPSQFFSLIDPSDQFIGSQFPWSCYSRQLSWKCWSNKLSQNQARNVVLYQHATLEYNCPTLALCVTEPPPFPIDLHCCPLPRLNIWKTFLTSKGWLYLHKLTQYGDPPQQQQKGSNHYAWEGLHW